jgi:hypothetical protein
MKATGRLPERDGPAYGPRLGGRGDKCFIARTNDLLSQFNKSAQRANHPKSARPFKEQIPCDDEDVPVICPTCQNVFAESLKASVAAAPFLLCMGLFSIFQLGASTAAPSGP